ncbi:OmpA family protein [Rubrolithibacter danxiaensis]|uniref:OmpA family protein n=1 Tax=Rubrolithibacter danxiaensis TaxID=3390805 RepID=UPI003BF79557
MTINKINKALILLLYFSPFFTVKAQETTFAANNDRPVNRSFIQEISSWTFRKEETVNKKMLSKADNHFKSLRFKTAIPLYLNAIKTDAENNYIISQLAECYRNIKDYQNAEKWYGKLVAFDNTDSESVLHYAEALASNGKYEQSAEWYEKYHQLNPSDENSQKFSRIYSKVGDLYADSLRWQVSYSSFNSSRADFSPAFFKRGLVFTSNRSPGSASKRIFGWDGTPFTDIYEIPDTANINVSNKINEIKVKPVKHHFSNPDDTAPTSNDSRTLGNISLIKEEVSGSAVNFSTEINSKYHDGPISFAQNGSFAVFNRNGKKSKDGTNRLKLFSAQYAGGQWFNLQSFQYNSDSYSVGHPALSEDGNTLYFISDMPGGFGGTDLYYSTRTTSGWSQPVNLGDAVNTTGNEMFPFLDNQGNLYFSSTGLPGLGGLDIFSVPVKNYLPAGNPKNIGYPVNSSKDDFGIIKSAANLSGYFSSNRLGNDDIFKFAFNPLNIRLKGFVFAKNENTSMGLEGAKIIVKTNNVSDTLNTNNIGTFQSDLEPNKQYQIEVMKDGYITSTASVNTEGINQNKTFELNLDLAKINISKPVPVLSETDLAVHTIYYNFNKSALNNTSIEELDKMVEIMKNHKDVNILATSFTDSRGSNSYNLELSKKRSNSVKAYLIENGIAEDRIITSYKGEAELVTRCANGIKCTEKEQMLNRRTEFRIVIMK